MSASNPQTANINFTDSAARKVKALIDEEQNQKLNLRVYITGGGCSGFQYGFTFDETINDDDFIVEKTVLSAESNNSEIESKDDGGGHSGAGSVKLLIDPLSYQYLQNAEIDYREDINGAQFVIRNPNAKTTCGCGSSFSA